MALTSIIIPTTPFDGQKPGTSGLRKKVKVFMEKNYTENFVQCILDAQKDKLKNCTLVVGGDGRYFSKQAINIIIRICAANGVAKLLLGQGGILSTPAVSNLIRNYKTLGGIVLTASHNPGGIRNDFGIKYNIENGGPAPDQMTDEIFKLTKEIKQYKFTPELDCDFSKVGVQHFEVDGRKFTVEVIDPVEDYLILMKSIFNFEKLKNLIKGSENTKPFNVLIDSMNGVTGPYVKRIFLDEFGANSECAVRIIPLDNFGEIHPDPNLTYAKDLVDKVRNNSEYDLGSAFDGDGDRNMIIGKNAFFVTPSDSLAVLANNLNCIPYFQKNGITGFARSMPTGSALDRVATKLKKEMFEVPTGWKYFGNLMDASRLSLCGEESFGTGSDHIREKDGVWAVLAWLSVIEFKKMSIEEILIEHWKEFGRNYFTRYDYEECEAAPCQEMIDKLLKMFENNEIQGKSFSFKNKSYTVKMADNFSYIDPIDKSEAKNQGARILFEDGSRIIFRLSGTGSSGATVRLYVDSYEKDNIIGDAQEMLKPLVEIALKMSNLRKYTGRDEPTVIT